MKFTKMHGIGNDYIYVNCFEEKVDNPEKVSIYVSDRRKGIGSDGLVLIMPSDKADFRMRIFNADGSEADMCGNGLRCCALHALRTTGKFPDALVTAAGSIETRLICRSPFVCALNLGRPIFSDLPDGAGGEGCRAVAQNTGAPHIVVANCGLACAESMWRRNKDSFNVDWVQIKKDGILKIVTFERGVGRTAACGTGAAAAFAASRRVLGFSDLTAKVSAEGGDTEVYEENGNIWIAGEARFVYDGNFCADDFC